MNSTARNRPVLIIEDEPAALEAMCEIFRSQGYLVAAANDGRKGLEYLRSGLSPRVIILDLRMPGMDGWQFKDCLRQNPAFVNIPVVIVTALPQRAPADVAATFKKPVNIPALLQTVARYC
ncbi:MAG: response regulator [Candidatus Binataceae bacterium]|nr:response regulator [Candidatus Binataceae bacterium]